MVFDTPKWGGAIPAFILAVGALVAIADFLSYSPCIGCAIYYAIVVIVWIGMFILFALVVAQVDYVGRGVGISGLVSYALRTIIRTFGAFYLFARGRLDEMKNIPVIFVQSLIIETGIVFALSFALFFDQAAIGAESCVLLPIATLFVGAIGHAFIGYIYLRPRPLPPVDLGSSSLGAELFIDGDMQAALNDTERGSH